jgi:hypothetical protein
MPNDILSSNESGTMTTHVKTSVQELLALGVELELIVEGEKEGVAKMIALVEDEKWTFAETERRLTTLLPAAAIISVTPQGHFAGGDAGPLLEVLRKGEADAVLQEWIADMIEQGGFAQRKTLSERIEGMGPLGLAIEDLDYVETLLRERGQSRGAHQRAKEIVALRHRVPLPKLDQYLKRGSRDRRKIMKRVTDPFSPHN